MSQPAPASVHMATDAPLKGLNMNDLVVADRASDWRTLKALVLDSVSSPITKRVYRLGLDEFFAWYPLRVRAGLWEETISDAMDGQEVAWSTGILFQLVAQPHHVSVNRAGVRIGFVSPDGVQDDLTRQDAIRILQEESKKVVFRGCELYFRAAPHDTPAIEVNLRVRKAHNFLDVSLTST
jgi:hypothetical protein